MREGSENTTPDTGHASRGEMMMSALEAATTLGVSERTIRRAIARNELNAAKHAGVYRIAPDDLTRFGLARGLPLSLAARRHRDPVRLIPLSGRSPAQAFHGPRSMTPLIGREHELGELRNRLLDEEIQLVTLVGPGGVGKTRLALEVGASLPDAFPDGVWFIDLVPLSNPAQVSGAIASALGAPNTGGRSRSNRLIAYLEQRQALLLLDNFERVTDAAPWLVTLLAACPKLKALVTSRVSLHVSGEYLYPIPPLRCPVARPSLSMAEVASSGAVRLFVVRAQAARPEFELTESNMAAVAAVCRQLDGLPLAIELAAARVTHLNPSTMLFRLDHRLDLLTGGMRDHPARMQSMRDAIAWSYDLLTPDEQHLFRRLSVFVDGFTLDAAAAVCERDEPDPGNQQPAGETGSASPVSPTSVLDGVSSLIDKSLVESARAHGDEPRYTILETLREYGLERLEASDELVAVREQHAAWCLSLAESVEAERIGHAPPVSADRLGPDRGNVRAALQWLSERSEVITGLRLASVLWPLWMDRGEVSEGHSILAALLSLPGASADQRVWARALCVSGALAQSMGDHDQAEDQSRQALKEFRSLGDVRGEAFALNTLGLDAMSHGRYTESESLLRESMASFRAVGDPRAGGWAMRHLSGLAYRHGDVARAAALASEGLSLVRQTANPLDIARLSLNVSLMAVAQLDLERARSVGQEALALFREEGDRWGEAYSLMRLGRVAQEQGDLAEASANLDACLALLQDIGDLEGTAVVFVHLGWVNRAQGAQPVAARQFAAGLALGRERHHPSCIASALLGAGAMALDRGDLRAAAAAWEESLRIATELEDRVIIASALEWSSHVAAPAMARLAARVQGAASALRDKFGFPLGVRLQAEHSHVVRGLRTHLRETAYKAAIAEGRRMPLDEAIAGTMRILDQARADPPAVSLRAMPDPSRAGLDTLTRREIDVLRMLADGQTDRKIGDALSISPRTVGAHVTHLLAKLGVESRTAAVAHALRNGLD